MRVNDRVIQIRQACIEAMKTQAVTTWTVRLDGPVAYQTARPAVAAIRASSSRSELSARSLWRITSA
nr:hypothetical protein GCM10020092_026900 [Actinoplanes digitatis]